jgi:hypothetical protein
MTKRIQKLVMTVAALAAFALGGAVFAQAQSSPKAASEKTSAVDTDNVQSGDQTTPDVTKKSEKTSAVDTDNIQSGDQTTPDVSKKTNIRNAANSTAGQSGNQNTPDTGTTSETAGENPGSESAPGNDGPGGHADEPGTPNADHQFSGTE